MDLDFNQYAPDGTTVVGEAHLTDTGVDQANLDSIDIAEAQRGNGYGSQLLHEVLAAADADNVTLTLTAAVPAGGSPFNVRSLLKWFGRNGFNSSDEDIAQMVRQPNPA